MQKKCEIAMAFLIVLMLVFVSFSVGISYGEDDTDHDSINSIAIVEVNGRTDISILNEHDVDVIERYGTYALIDAVEETFESLENSGIEVNTLPKRTTLNIKGMEFDFTEGDPDIPDELRIEGYESGTEGQYIVHMLGPIAPEWRSQLEEKGVDVMNYLPNYAYRVWMSPEMAEKVEDLYFVDWVGIYHPYYKLNTGLEPGTVEIGFVETDEGLKERISSKGVEIDSFVDLRYRNAGYQMVADVYEEETLHEIARSNHVSYISEYSEPTLDSEVDSQIIGGGAWIMDDEDGDPGTAYRKHGNHGAYINQIGYTGEGVTIAIADSGLGDGTTPSAGHPDFEGRVVGGHSFEHPHMWADDLSHGTHVAGSAAGNTVEGTGVQYAGLDGEYYAGQGLAYESELYPIRIFSGMQNFLPDDIFEVVEVAAQDSEAYVHSNSWSKTNNGNYISVDNAFDYTARDANNDTDYDEPMVIVSSAGNSGPQYGSTGSPGNGKNVISVGATETYMLDAEDYGGVSRSNPDNVFDSSSRGWASDNRVKPDVVAPGTSILSTTSPSITNAYYDTWFKSGEYIFDINYNWKSGTSMSTPAVAGAAAVTTEWYEENYGERPSPAMVKALLINTAEPLREDQTGDDEINYIPNKHEGWGMVDISKLEYPYENPVPFYFEDQSSILTTGEVDEYEIRYDRSEEPLKLSLTWTDAPAPPGTGIGDALVNDLNLEVETPSGEIIRGNAFDLDGDGESDDGFTYPDAEVMDYFDSNGNGWDDTNNVQNVYIPSDDVETGVYTVRIRARDIGEDAVGVGYNSQD